MTAVSFLAVAPQVAGNPEVWSMSYTAVGEPGPDRQQVIDAAIAEFGHDDFCVATLHDGRIVAYGCPGPGRMRPLEPIYDAVNEPKETSS